MSETPMTDAVVIRQPNRTERTDGDAYIVGWDGSYSEYVPADFARQRERELVAAQSKLGALHMRLNPSIEHVEGTPVGYGDDEIDRLHVQLAAAQRDAERYRWLRACGNTVLAQRDGYSALPRLNDLDAAIDAAQRDALAKQAQIDRLMLEYCPDEMTPEQIEEWKRHQVAATPEQDAAIDSAMKEGK